MDNVMGEIRNMGKKQKRTIKRTVSALSTAAILLMVMTACGRQASSQTENTEGKNLSSVPENFQKQEESEGGENTAAEGESGENTGYPGREVTVTELYSVDDEIVNEEYDYVVEYSYHVPQIDDDTPGAAEINSEIAAVYGGLVERSLNEIEQGELTGCASITYEAYQSGDIFSLVLLCTEYFGGYEEYGTYNYDTREGVRLGNEKVLEKKGLTGEEYLSALRRAAVKYYDNLYFNQWDEMGEWCLAGAYQERRAFTVSERNITMDLPLYIDNSGKLHTIVPIGSHIEADWLNEIITPEFQQEDMDVETVEYMDFLTVKRQGSNVTLRFKKTDYFNELLAATSYYTYDEVTVPYGKEVEVNGLYGDYTRIFCEGIGEMGAPYLFLLTEEGRVEYINVMGCLYAGYFCANGPLLGAAQVKDFELGENEIGYQMIYAVTGSGERIDLNEMIWGNMGNIAYDLLDCSWGTGSGVEDGPEFFLRNDSDGFLSFELMYNVPGEEYRTGLDGSFTYLGITEQGVVYHYVGNGINSNGPVWQGAVALYVESDYSGEEPITLLYVTELGGNPLFEGETGDVTVLLQTFG